ncbi:alpha/beta hydrolase [Dactylosporangium sp. CA-139114]|uniref:alpha/beta hydrolase n=1 Tax=Dactylosporangium sp. CA-139114 TaxID=3239931 RepID=UPI003D983A08
MHGAQVVGAATRTSVWRWLHGLLFVLPLLVTAMLVCTPDTAHAHAVPCQRLDSWVALTPDAAARYRVAGWLCRPARPTATVQVLMSGFTYDHTYWDSLPSEGRSYVRAAADAGTAVYNVDRVGVGLSDRPPAEQVTAETEAYVAHQLVQRLRQPPFGYTRVVGVGHSYGSAVWMVEAATQHDVDALVLTGYLHEPNTTQQAVIAAGLHPAGDDQVFAGDPMPDGYVTTKTDTRGLDFYYLPGADRSVINRDERTKATGTTGERATMGLARDPFYSRHITAPVLLIVGDHDALSCDDAALPCSTAAQVCARERPYYPAGSQVSVVVIPGAGHSIHGHRTAPLEFVVSNAWSRTALSAPGRAAYWPGRCG